MKVPQKTREFLDRAAHELSRPAWFNCKQHSLYSKLFDCKSVLPSLPSFHLLNNAWVRLWKSMVARRNQDSLRNRNNFVGSSGMASQPGVSRERVARDGEGAVDDNRLAEGGRNDVVSTEERGEDFAIGEAADWIEPGRFADQGDSSAEHDTAWGENSDYLGEGECKGGAGCCQNGGCITIACRGGFGDDHGGDSLGVEAGRGRERASRFVSGLSGRV